MSNILHIACTFSKIFLYLLESKMYKFVSVKNKHYYCENIL